MPESHFPLDNIQQHMAMPGFGFGQWAAITVTRAAYGLVEAQLTVREDMSRPGGTVAGPVMMGLADAAMWAGAMTVNAQGNQSVTSDLTIHFLRRPAAQVLKCRAQVVKDGRTLIVFRADLTCDDDPTVVCACQGTYAMPGKQIIPA